MESLFSRPDHTYELSNDGIKRILVDEASPIKQIIDYIPDNKKILDIGAGNGLIGNIFSHLERDVIVDGIEPSPAGAKIAKKYYRNFYEGYCQDFWTEISRENYDYVLLADVIEHIIDPQDFLDQLTKHLRHDCRIVFSVPNIAFGAMRIALMNGDFNYVNSGLLEKTHVRFFTKSTLEKVLKSLHLNIEHMGYLNRNVHQSEIPLEGYKLSVPSKVKRDGLFYVYQFFVVATRDQVSLTVKSYGAYRSFYPYLLWKKKLKRFIKKMRDSAYIICLLFVLLVDTYNSPKISIV